MRLIYLVFGLGCALALVLYKAELASIPIPYLDKYLLGINLLAFAVYTLDKLMAAQDLLRVPEKVMLLLAALGGAGGGALSQGLFKHKVTKLSFKIKFVVASAVPLANLIFLMK